MKRKQSNYSKYRKKLLAKVSRLKSRGIIVDIEKPKTEQQLRKSGIKGNELARETNRIKNQLQNFKEIQVIDTTTGEISSYGTVKHERAKDTARKSAETRKRNKESERRFWSNQEYEHTDYIPDGGEIIADNIVDTLISRLSQPVPTSTAYEKRRTDRMVEISERERVTLYSLTMSVIARDGRSTLGWRLQEHADVIDELLMIMFVASKQEQIESSSRQLARIINGSDLSMSDLMDLGYEQEQNEEW